MWKKILKISFIVLLLGILAGLVTWLVLSKRWPWWVGVALMVGLTGVWVGVLFLRKYLQRRREKVFVSRVIAQDEAVIKTAPIHERQRLQELQDRWKESVERLRGSYLRKRGNPLYVLPWYLVIGESGSGKTSAIRNAGLSSPITDTGPTTGISATRNCDWWFFEEAVILDTAGRYTIPIDEGPDKEEWKNFLTLLARYRRREPLNGVIVTISADKLLSPDDSVLREDGQSVRQRIDQLMRATGAKFPVYLLVTKMDLVHGFVGFCGHLSGDDVSQAMGSLNENLNPYWNEFLEHSLDVISKRLGELRLIMAHRGKPADPGALFFPNEFEQLTPGIQVFVKAVFEENPYQETPLFRGLYFSSARQEGRPQSEFLSLTGIVHSANSDSAGENGLFLKDIFKSVLPNDRYLYRPVQEFLRWRTLASNQGLLAWVMVWFSLCGFLSYSFFKNSVTIGEFTKDFYTSPTLTGDMSSDLLMLDKLRMELMEMERKNRNWWVPRFGLDQSLRIEQILKRNFIQTFDDGFLRRFDTLFDKHIENVSRHTPDDEVALYVSYLVNRINIYREVLRGEKHIYIARFDNNCTALITRGYPEVVPEVASKFDDLYYVYLTWNEHKGEFQGKVKELRVTLKRILEKRGGSLEWLVKIYIPNVTDVRLRDFWGATEEGRYNEQILVSGAYTGKGRKDIQDFIVLMDEVLTDEKVGEENKNRFWNWYWQHFYESWAGFAGQFSEGMDGLVTVSAWKYMVALMTTDQNPYFLLLDRMADEFGQGEKGKLMPKWASLVLYLNDIRQISKAKTEKTKGTLTGRIKSLEEKLVERAKDVADKNELKKHEENLKVAKVWEEYGKTIEQLSPVASSLDTCFSMVSGYFNPGRGEKQSPFLSAGNQGLKFKSMVRDEANAPFVWDIVFGPYNFLVDFSIMEAGCALQGKWEEQILGTLEGVGRDKATQILFNKSDGAVWKFLAGPAQPFVVKSKNGYIVRKKSGRSIPFNPEFFDFLNAGAEHITVSRTDYEVAMKTLPLQVNEGTRSEPYGSIISVDCQDGNASLENYNYPQSKTFHWSPDKCGDVTVKILLPDLVLTKTYEGQMGFAKCLSEFRYGTRTFKAEEFPDEQKRLTDMGISWIRLSYLISGKKAVVRLLEKSSVQTPEEIIPCWSR